jgi:hypothetical protein
MGHLGQFYADPNNSAQGASPDLPSSGSGSAMRKSNTAAVLELFCVVCAAASTKTPVVAKLNTLGWLSGVDATSCTFNASKGYTCINHTVCVDCLGEAKSSGNKCGPILRSSSDRRHQLSPGDPSSQTAPAWICTTHRNHRAAAAAAESFSPCACDCHIQSGISACKKAADTMGRGRKKKVKRGRKPKQAPPQEVIRFA